MILAGNGEVFASPLIGKFMKQTSAILNIFACFLMVYCLYPANWEHFKKNNNVKIMLTVSEDAASKETYQYIRRGNFDVLQQNMRFAPELRPAKVELSYFRLNFVVQREKL